MARPAAVQYVRQTDEEGVVVNEKRILVIHTEGVSYDYPLLDIQTSGELVAQIVKQGGVWFGKAFLPLHRIRLITLEIEK